jgi:hypothetical protein
MSAAHRQKRFLLVARVACPVTPDVVLFGPPPQTLFPVASSSFSLILTLLLPVILRYQQNMAQARNLGVVRDGRSLAEGYVPSLAMSALSLPWIFVILWPKGWRL